jgi:Flp pilus assembly protein TadD
MAELRGLLLARTHQTTQAEPVLQQAMDRPDRVDPDVAEALARIYLGEFRLSRAAGVLDRWTRDWPDDARPFFLQTEIDARNHAPDDAILAHLQAALERNPKLDQARLRLADLLRSLHRNRDASVEYASYQARRPDDPYGYLGAGQNALDLADLTEAVRCLDRALELSPHDPVVLGARAALAIREGQFDRARVYLDRAVQADPYDYSNRYQRMLLLNREGKKAEADAERLILEQIRTDQAVFADLSRQLERDPLNPELRRQAATWLMSHAHEEEAVDWAKLVLQVDPADPAMNRLLADYYQRTGNMGLANLHAIHATPLLDRSRSDR